MQTSFLASGFLYNLKTRQILLLQSTEKDDISFSWSTLRGESKEGEDTQITFQRIVRELLNLELKEKHIYPVYDYFYSTLNKINYVFYAEVKNPPAFISANGNTFSWVSFSEIVKLPFSANSKQDIVVGERVINLKRRQDQESAS